MTKTWSFGAPCGPLQFSQEGWRERARQALREGDRVVIVATLGDEPDEEERGKLLGMMEPTNQVVQSLDYDLERGPQDFDEHGAYKWPYGLEIKDAWRFLEPRPGLRDISSRRFGMNAALGIVQLTPEEEARVLALPHEQVRLLQPIRRVARQEGDDAARRRGAPPPSTKRNGIMHLRKAPAFTYAMKIDGIEEPAVKIGWAFDWSDRQRQFNLVALPHLGGPKYNIWMKEIWPTAYGAYDMEQALLRQFDSLRHPHNREVLVPIRAQEFERAWIEDMARSRRHR
jgi:hypothetical protein